jgi:isopropylmalate/homocitrate/citramalate synthase
MRWERRSSPRSARPAIARTRPDDDPNLRELVAAETPVVTIFGKSWLLHVIEVLGATPAENLDMIADSVGFVVDAGARRLRRRALLRRLQGRSRLRARDPAGRPAGRRRARSCCATRTAGR